MQQEKQEKKKTSKRRDPMKHSAYRSRTARRLREQAADLMLQAKLAIRESEEYASGWETLEHPKAVEALAKGKFTAAYLSRKANDLLKKASRITDGAKRHHASKPKWIRVDEHNRNVKAWDFLHPKDEEVHRPLLAVITVLEVSTMGALVKAPACPIIGVAWDQRIAGEPVPDAPMSVVAQVGELNSTVFRLY